MKKCSSDYKKLMIAILIILLIINIPITYLHYKSNLEKIDMYEQISEAVYRIPEYYKYIVPIADIRLSKRDLSEGIDISEPTNMKYVLSKFTKDDWIELIKRIPKSERSEIQELVDRYGLTPN